MRLASERRYRLSWGDFAIWASGASRSFVSIWPMVWGPAGVRLETAKSGAPHSTWVGSLVATILLRTLSTKALSAGR